MSHKEEMNYILDFAKGIDFGYEGSSRQLRSLWTAYCLHNNIDVDSNEYDVGIAKIWDVVYENETNCWVDNDEEFIVGYDEFDSYMSDEII